MQRAAIAATLFSLALTGGAAAQGVVATNPVTGAATGAAAGAAQGAAVAGPVGAIVGAPLGLAAGAVAGTVGAVGTVAGAAAGGPLVVNVAPGGVPATAGAPAGIGTPVVINGVVYDRVPARALVRTGPRYTERSGVRVGRGSVIPEWIDAAPMRNVSIRRLRPGAAYGYFVSPDNKAVVIEPGSRRVARVISPAG
jgi:hypothetical protein